MIKTLIVDDEPLAGEILETYISQVPSMELVGRCYNAIEANEFINNNEVDLLLLDIEMPQLNGIDFIKNLNISVQVIFTTAYPEFALEGFNVNAVDYLLKPISFDRFLKAINKVKVKSKLNSGSNIAEADIDYIFVKADKKLVKILYSDIIYVEGMKDYVIIKTESTRVITLQTMMSLEKKLPPELFVRIHRSYIVNFNKLHAITSSEVEVIEKNQIKALPIGKNYKEVFDAVIESKRL